MSNEKIARTGRVTAWMDNPESRLPVSCTVFVVEDECEGVDGIEASWRFTSYALRHGAGVSIHLSKLRQRGATNGKGLVASGPTSFARIYSTLNEVLRRGGAYRNGAVVCHLDMNHPDVEEFVDATRNELPWVKKCLDVTQEWWDDLEFTIREKVIQAIRSGDLWLNKVKYGKNGNRIYGNVCLEVYLPSRGTCLLQHINLAACRITDLTDAFTTAMEELCQLHRQTGVERSGEYLPPTLDRQVGLGVLGLANFLAGYGVTYEEFGKALSAFNSGRKETNNAGSTLVAELKFAIDSAARIARQSFMERAFCIAPTATCSFNYEDLNGYTATPEIAPPIARKIDRDSGTFGVTSYDYGPVEIASEVGWKNYARVAAGIVKLFENTGLFHGYSFNSWSDIVTYNEEFIQAWLDSPQTSLYYSLQVQPDTQRKDDIDAIIDDESYTDMFAFERADAAPCSVCAE